MEIKFQGADGLWINTHTEEALLRKNFSTWHDSISNIIDRVKERGGKGEQLFLLVLIYIIAMSLVSKMGSTPSGCQGIAANVVKSYTSDFDSDFFWF